MAYVSVDAPLPRNSLTPLSPCEIARARAIVSGVEESVANARRASAMIAPPEAFREFGPGVVRDVQRSQAELIAGNTLTLQPKRVGDVETVMRAPEVLPLNVPAEEFLGCGLRATGPLLPITISADQQKVLMPRRAPVDTNLIVTGNQFPGPGRGVNNPGMGIVWGDASGYPERLAGNNGGAEVNWTPLLWIAAAGLGLWALGKGKR